MTFHAKYCIIKEWKPDGCHNTHILLNRGVAPSILEPPVPADGLFLSLRNLIAMLQSQLNGIFDSPSGLSFFMPERRQNMDTNQIVQLIVAILTGLATCIPLAVKLVEYVKTATKEKNWANLLGLVMSLMEQAEKKFDDGATRKEWVMAMVKASADYINYPVDEDTLSKMIDSLCDMSKIVNGTTEQEVETV